MKLLERNVTWWGLWHQEWGKAAGSVSPEWQSWKVIGELFGFVAYDYLEDLLNGFLPVFSSEWWSAGQHVIHQGPKGPPIDCLREKNTFFWWLTIKPHLSMPCPSEYLWSHVLNSATEGVRHLPKYHHIFIFFRSIKSISLLSPDSFDFNHNYRLFVNGLFTKAKICELHMTSCVKEDVFWL